MHPLYIPPEGGTQIFYGNLTSGHAGKSGVDLNPQITFVPAWSVSANQSMSWSGFIACTATASFSLCVNKILQRQFNQFTASIFIHVLTET